MMLMEFHDDEVGNSHAFSAWNIEDMPRAEGWVKEMAENDAGVVKCILRSYEGEEIRRWERNDTKEEFREVYNSLMGVGKPEPIIPTEHVWRFHLVDPETPRWRCSGCQVIVLNTSHRERFDRKHPTCHRHFLN